MVTTREDIEALMAIASALHAFRLDAAGELRPVDGEWDRFIADRLVHRRRTRLRLTGAVE